ncbi:MAG: SDR family NAD(P)-dependent oxidoreductase [Streptosporangiaceae bacterium]
MTGASQGIGAAIVEALAVAGVALMVSGQNADRLTAFAADLADRIEVQVTPIAADLAEANEVERLATESLAVLDGLDILVNNAGISIPESIGSVTARSWDAVMALNVCTALLSARVGAAIARRGWPTATSRR